jgi:hypothetical protein
LAQPIGGAFAQQDWFSEYVPKADRMEKGAGKILVAGGGGFIGGHLVAEFICQGYTDIRVVDCKPFVEWHQIFPQVENVNGRARRALGLQPCCRHGRHVFHRDPQGGMHAVGADQHARADGGTGGGGRASFLQSSACVYAAEKQTSADVVARGLEAALRLRGAGWLKERQQREG